MGSVTFMFARRPATTADAHIRQVAEDDGAVVGRVKFGSALSDLVGARVMAESRKPCGVWPRRSVARGGTSMMTSSA